MSARAGHFAAEGLALVPRVLGLCDRDPDSATFGCADRAYWHYRLTDYANARFQEAGLLFALAFTLDLPGNRFHAQPAMARWARAAWRFWLKRRNRDGSVAEAWPGDRGFCATSFSAAAFAETVALLGGAAEWAEELREARPTFAWLAAHGNPEVANQQAGSAWALAGWGTLTGETAWADRRIAEALALQDAQGWFPEYGGADTGYQSITMAALARTLRLTGRDDVRQALSRAGEALAARVGEDGSVDCAANSRGTQYLYPSALPEAAAERLMRGQRDGVALRPSWMDDRYCTAIAIDHLFAGM